MRNPGVGGYAVANDVREHQALTAMGYEPPLDETPLDVPHVPVPELDTVDALRLKCETAGVPYDKRWGVARLKAALGED